MKNKQTIMCAVGLSVALGSTLHAQTTQIRDFGSQLERKVDHVADFELVEMDPLMLLGPNIRRKIVPPQAPVVCAPIQETGTYLLVAKGAWELDPTGTGARELSIRILRNNAWLSLAQDIEPKLGTIPRTHQVIQQVMAVEPLERGDCVGTLAFFRSRTKFLNFGLVSLLIVKQ